MCLLDKYDLVPEVMRVILYNDAFKSGCSGVTTKALPVFLIAYESVYIRGCINPKQSIVPYPVSISLETKIKALCEFGK